MKHNLIKDIRDLEPMTYHMDLLSMSLEDLKDLAHELVTRKIKSILRGKSK